MSKIMKTLDDKIEEINANERSRQEEIINTCEQFLNHKGGPFNFGGITALKIITQRSTKEEIQTLKAVAETKINDDYKVHPIGWPYFDDVCYLDLGEYEGEEVGLEILFDEVWLTHLGQTEYNKINLEEMFNALNYLKYLYREIKHLGRTQKNFKRNRITPPSKEIISILEYIDSRHEATIPLIKLLATFEGDYSSEILSYDNRINYKAEKESSAQSTPPPPLNIDSLSKLKDEYKERIKALYELIKQQNPLKYKKLAEAILKDLSLPSKPSEI